MERFINIDGIGRNFKASGATPRIYRSVCGRDLLTDLARLDADEYSPDKLLIYEDLAYVMAKQGNDALPDSDERKIKNFPATPDEWLDGIEVLDIYDILPQIAQLWRENQGTTVTAKKNRDGHREN